MDDTEKYSGRRLSVMSDRTEDFVQSLKQLGGHGLVLAAHPDDESIGCAALIFRLPGINVVYATDGSPRNLHDAFTGGFTSQSEYASARLKECQAALGLLGVLPWQIHTLACIDQEASFELPAATRRLIDLAVKVRPAFLLTHAYEGGHPDHDAACFVAHAAVRQVESICGTSIPLFEFTSYHNACGSTVVGNFITSTVPLIVELTLSPEERELKRRVFAAYKTQAKVLQMFPLETERFRVAPLYTFTSPPHPGELHYERYGWGIDGHRWRVCAAAALDELRLTEPL